MIEILKKFALWFFNTPTPIITILSLIIAYFTYKYQRRWNKRQYTKELTEWYVLYGLPRIRYLSCILEEIGFIDICQKFSKFEDFDSKELNENINKASSSTKNIESLFLKITDATLNLAFAESGGSDCVQKINQNLIYIYNTNSKIGYETFKKVVIDLLNEIEVRALQLNCGIYDEAMVYPILHQTYLKNIRYFYYFVSSENSQDYDQFYIYTIWLYNVWNRRVETEKTKLKKSFQRKSKTSKL